jgi:6-phosphogluconolactonase
MEIKLRMSKRFVAWMSLALVALVALGLLVACGTLYSPSSDGLMLVGSQGTALIETYSFNLSNGHLTSVSNPPSDTSLDTCVLPGLPGSMVVDPAGAYAYVILKANSTCSGSQTGIASFKINSNGTIAASGTVTADPNPVALLMDPSGKFLFVAEGPNSLPNLSLPNAGPCPGTTQQFGVCTYSISNGALTPVPGNITFTNASPNQAPNIVAIAVTPTIFPNIGINGVQNSVCTSQNTPAPTQEFLYAADFQNNIVWEFGVNMSTGALSNPTGVPSFAAGTQPNGVAVDPCNRFVFVANYLSNNVSAYTICNGSSTSAPPPACPASPATPDGSLVPAAGSPFSLPGNANGPGPMVADPFGHFIYVLTGTTTLVAGSVTPFQIAAVSGALTSKGIVATGAGPVSIAIRGDDNWLFVANYIAGTVSQYAITPESGALAPQPVVQTDSYPWGVAVK